MKNQENARKHLTDEIPLALRLTTILGNRDSDPDPPERSPTHQTGRQREVKQCRGGTVECSSKGCIPNDGDNFFQFSFVVCVR